MSPNSTASKLGWLNDILKNTWQLLVQAAVWICTFIASMIFPPVSGVNAGDADPTGRLSNYTIFIVAVIVGISFVIATLLNKKKHVWIWIVLTVLFFITSIVLVNRNYRLNDSLVCSCQQKSIIRGTEYKDPEVIRVFFPNGIDCAILCERFLDKDGKVVPEKVWSESSIKDSRRKLFLSYVSCFPAVALTIVSVVQAIYCSVRKRRET